MPSPTTETTDLHCSGGHSAPAEEFAIDRTRKSGHQSFCRACKSNRMFGYFLTLKGAESRRQSVEKWRRLHPDRATAHQAVARAVYFGILAPACDVGCALAGTPGHICRGSVSYHHTDYDRPLDVVALCRAGHDVADHHPEQLPVPVHRLLERAGRAWRAA